MSEQSYTHKSLLEIRSMVANRVGLDPEGDSNDMRYKQLNEFIRSASLEANEQCQWVHAQQTIDVTTRIQQGEIPFPAGCGPGSVLQVSIWLEEEDRQDWFARCGYLPPPTYVPLKRHLMQNNWDSDPALEAGGDEAEDAAGIPVVWDVRQAIRIRPVTNKAYRMRILYTNTPELVNDNDHTAMDAEIIMLLAMAQYKDYEEDFVSRDRYQARAQKRIVRLRAQQSTDQLMEQQRGINLALSTDEESLLDLSGCDCPRFDLGYWDRQTYPARSS